MNKKLYQILRDWPKSYITDTDLSFIIEGSDDSRYGLINRAIKKGFLIHIRRGLYEIALPEKRQMVDLFELAQMIYGPSFVSIESALQYHNIIPEGIYAITSVTTKRSMEFTTPLSLFLYRTIPKTNFLLGVERIEKNAICYFMAQPWRAIADLIYLNRKNWSSIKSMCDDMRINEDLFLEKTPSLLVDLAEEYPNKRTRQILKNLK
ncbi:MAG: hypothetical protein HZB76_04275 [Chlamydiae bacterium]|nr:hypothetical protein [Chlamydiota bacterium]